MPGLVDRESDDAPPSALDAALRAIPDVPLPDGLLESCLATVPGPGQSRPSRWPVTMVRLAAAALMLVATAAFFSRSRHADAAELLQAVKAAWTTVPASHSVLRVTSPGGIRTEETWVSRRLGFRRETRLGGDLIGIVVRGERWEFRWDVRGRTVAAWSTALASADRPSAAAGLVLDRNGFETWARSHRAGLAAEADTIGGRAVQKLTLTWPSGTGMTQTDTVWFDPGSFLPMKQRTQAPDGRVVETSIDYPSSNELDSDLFTLAIPRDAVLEVNDPELGRPLYSDQQGAKR